MTRWLLFLTLIALIYLIFEKDEGRPSEAIVETCQIACGSSWAGAAYEKPRQKYQRREIRCACIQNRTLMQDFELTGMGL